MSVASRPVLEIQVKRTIAITSTDKGFRSVVDQIALTSRKPEVMPQKKLSANLARSRLLGSLPRSILINGPAFWNRPQLEASTIPVAVPTFQDLYVASRNFSPYQ